MTTRPGGVVSLPSHVPVHEPSVFPASPTILTLKDVFTYIYFVVSEEVMVALLNDLTLLHHDNVVSMSGGKELCNPRLSFFFLLNS